MDEMGARTDQRLQQRSKKLRSKQTLFGKDSTAPKSPSTNLHWGKHLEKPSVKRHSQKRAQHETGTQHLTPQTADIPTILTLW